MTTSIDLLPAPRRATFGDEVFSLPQSSLILLDAPRPQDLLFAARRFQSALDKMLKLKWERIASRSVPAEQVGLVLRVAPERAPQPQGYWLHITPGGMLIEGHEPAGVFYGVCTLIQILNQCEGELPCAEIQDWPDFSARGVMLDISRNRVYSMETLFELVDRLAGWKINQLQLYTENTFAYRNHPMVWKSASPMTGEDILTLDAYCRERFIELVPNQNSFGHMERWLVHAPYASLAETHDEFDTPWGTRLKGPFSLAPENPGSIALVSSLYDELLPHFTSRQVNVGCDETIDLGAGASREACAKRGAGRVYLDYLLKLYANVKQRDFNMQFWGDIINQHPDLVAELPRDVIALEWGYEAGHPFDQNGARFAASGVPFYVCPGTSSWCSIAGRTDNAQVNLLNAAENGLKHGAIGYLITDWGDGGHWQVPPVSYPGFAMGAAFSWALEANRDADFPTLVSFFAFEDIGGAMGEVACELGNVYRYPSIQVPNGSVLFWALQRRLDQLSQQELPTVESLQSTMAAIDEAMVSLDSAHMARPDGGLIHREYLNTARMLRHAVRRLLLAHKGDDAALRRELAADMREIIDEFRALWLARSRYGGLDESCSQLEAAYQDYL